MEIEMSDINLDTVFVEDANEIAKDYLKNLPTEETHIGFDGIHCVDCGDPVDEKRLSLIKSCRCSECKPFYDKEMRAKSLKVNLDYYTE